LRDSAQKIRLRYIGALNWSDVLDGR
jgi:hypothetical protein